MNKALLIAAISTVFFSCESKPKNPVCDDDSILKSYVSDCNEEKEKETKKEKERITPCSCNQNLKNLTDSIANLYIEPNKSIDDINKNLQVLKLKCNKAKEKNIDQWEEDWINCRLDEIESLIIPNPNFTIIKSKMLEVNRDFEKFNDNQKIKLGNLSKRVEEYWINDKLDKIESLIKSNGNFDDIQNKILEVMENFENFDESQKIKLDDLTKTLEGL